MHVVDESAQRSGRKVGREAAHAQHDVAWRDQAARSAANPVPVGSLHGGARVVDHRHAVDGLLEVDARDAYGARYRDGRIRGVFTSQQAFVAFDVIETDRDQQGRGITQRPQDPGHIDALAASRQVNRECPHDRAGHHLDDGDRAIEHGVRIDDEDADGRPFRRGLRSRVIVVGNRCR